MKHDELADELAKEAGVAKAAAQDQIEELVQRILKKLRRGRSVALPGLGKLVARPGKRQ
jgi:nucleoid DNA-binding protein